MVNHIVNIENKFKHNCVELANICVDMIETGHENNLTKMNPAMARIGVPLIQNFQGSILIQKFMERTLPKSEKDNQYVLEYWNKIHERDIEYFKILGSQLFDMFQGGNTFNMSSKITDAVESGQISEFRGLLSAEYRNSDGKMVPVLDQEMKEDVWNIMNGMITLSIRYIYHKREFNKETKKYENPDFYAGLNLLELCKKWGIKSL